MMNLRPVDAVEVISVLDSAIEWWHHIDRKDVQRPGQWVKRDPSEWVTPVADGGLTILARTHVGGETHTLLLDAGVSPDITVQNARTLKLDLNTVEAVVISHGHADHYNGLLSVLEAIDNDNLPVLIHPNMFNVLGWKGEDGQIQADEDYFPSEEPIRAAGGKITDSSAPMLTAGDTVLVTGEIPRCTSYETGRPGIFMRVEDGSWQPYGDVRDERALAINVKDVGLVVLTGCGHAGVVNTVNCARELTGVDRLHMLMGGFHLGGKKIEPRIPQTVQDIAAFEPALLVPCHCTGFPAKMAFAQTMPDAFVANSTGNRYIVGALEE